MINDHIIQVKMAQTYFLDFELRKLFVGERFCQLIRVLTNIMLTTTLKYRKNLLAVHNFLLVRENFSQENLIWAKIDSCK